MQVLTNIGLESGFYITELVSNKQNNYRPVALQDTSLHNTGYSEQNQFLTNFIKTKFQPGFKPKFKPKHVLELATTSLRGVRLIASRRRAF